jgi:hypothetical protein
MTDDIELQIQAKIRHAIAAPNDFREEVLHLVTVRRYLHSTLIIACETLKALPTEKLAVFTDDDFVTLALSRMPEIREAALIAMGRVKR